MIAKCVISRRARVSRVLRVSMVSTLRVETVSHVVGYMFDSLGSNDPDHRPPQHPRHPGMAVDNRKGGLRGDHSGVVHSRCRHHTETTMTPDRDHVAIPLRVPRTLVARADALADAASDPSAGVRRSRAEILRVALAHGIAALEIEHEKETTK